jgi:TolA-binding protein
MESFSRQDSNIVEGDIPFIIVYWKQLALAIVLVLAAAIGFGVWKSQRDQKELEASAAIAAAKDLKARGEAAQKFLGSRQSALALLQIADDHYEVKEFDPARKAYETFLSTYPHHPLTNAARVGLAGVLESQGKTEDALKTYQQAAQHSPQDIYCTVARLNLARLYEASKNYAAARQALEMIISQAGQTSYATEAKEKLKTLPKA